MIVGKRSVSFAYSDLDIVMFWHEVPSDDARIQSGESFGRIHFIESFNHQAEFSLRSASEVIYVGENNLKVDITHKTIAAQTQKTIHEKRWRLS